MKQSVGSPIKSPLDAKKPKRGKMWKELKEASDSGSEPEPAEVVGSRSNSANGYPPSAGYGDGGASVGAAAQLPKPFADLAAEEAEERKANELLHVDGSPGQQLTSITSLPSFGEFASRNNHVFNDPQMSRPLTHFGEMRRCTDIGLSEEGAITSFLCTVPHLATLSYKELSTLHVMRREYAPMDAILEKDAEVQHVYIVISGSVDVFMEHPPHTKRVGSICPPQPFGLELVIFDKKSSFFFMAGAEHTVLGLISKEPFMKLLRTTTALSQSIARKIADHMDIFHTFKRFLGTIFGSRRMHKEYLSTSKLIDAYGNMNNLIHPLLASTEIDVGAWRYAVRCLPSNITDVHVLDIARSLPPFLSAYLRTHAEEGISSADIGFVETKKRRRFTWRIGHAGKDLVLLRDGFTDLVDFLSCLCIHVLEAQKLRNRLQSMLFPSAVDVLQGVVSSSDAQNQDVQLQTLARLPLSKKEIEGLMLIWPKDVVRRLFALNMHREEYLIRLDSSLSQHFESDRCYDWALNIRHFVQEKLGLSDNHSIPESMTIDVMFGNTQTSQNCLSAFARVHKQAILDWGNAEMPGADANFVCEDDFLYFLLPRYLAANEAAEEAFDASLLSSGITTMEDTALTGLQVDIIDLNEVPVEYMDTRLRDAFAKRKCSGDRYRHHFLLSVDYAFGAQADAIMRAIILTFGHRIRSFNVVGPASGMTGKLGDILLPTHALYSKSALITDDNTDELRECDNSDLSAHRIEELSGRAVHTGRVLTITSQTLLNAEFLRYYEKLWGCVGMETEGSYYARQLEECRNLDLLREDVRMRMAYYVSALPLKDKFVNTWMSSMNYLPALYAIVRSIMERIAECSSS